MKNRNIRKLIERAYYNNPDYTCNCPEPSNKIINETNVSNNMRRARILSSSIGGRITFGNPQGQIPQTIAPLRNAF
jgi:hypothetical protein